MSRIFDIADKYVDDITSLEPALATALGVPGHEREMPNLSPEGPARVAALNRRTVSDLEAASLEGDDDRIARDVMLERLGVSLTTFDSGEYYRALRNIASPLQGVRQVFDLMPRQTEAEWSNVAARLKLVPAALAGYRQTLNAGLEKGLRASKRQAQEGDEQARVWGGSATDEGKTSFFSMLKDEFDKVSSESGFGNGLTSDITAGGKSVV